MKYHLEVGARTVEDALAAERAGAARAELYSSPMEGALTPSAGLIKRAKAAVTDLFLQVMIRPRSGGFCYSKSEFEIMQSDTEIAVEMGADGIMFGILTENNSLDIRRMKDLIKRCNCLPVTLHRAFDFTNDPFRTLEEAIDLGCTYVMPLGQNTSGGFGRKMVEKFVKQAGNRIKVIIALGSSFDNAELDQVIKETGAFDYHIVNNYSQADKPYNLERFAATPDAGWSRDYLDEDIVRSTKEILNKYEN
jgi:copper homeostasis protein